MLKIVRYTESDSNKRTPFHKFRDLMKKNKNREDQTSFIHQKREYAQYIIIIIIIILFFPLNIKSAVMSTVNGQGVYWCWNLLYCHDRRNVKKNPEEARLISKRPELITRDR